MSITPELLSADQIEQLNQNIMRGPSAYAAPEICLEELIDLDSFPLHDLNSPDRRELVMQCRADLERIGCSHVSDFIRPAAIQKMRDEALRLLPQATRAEDFNSPYFGPDDPSLANDHPRRFFQTRNSAAAPRRLF